MQAYQLNQGDLELKFLSIGASLSSVKYQGQQVLRQIPDAEYLKSKGHFGSIAGPIANRVRNAKVTIDGNDYHLDKNQGDHTLHGGFKGLGLREWVLSNSSHCMIEFQITLKHLELGLPGDRTFTCRYTIANKNTLEVNLSMTANQTTMCNLAPHPYFCLDDSGTILDHQLEVFADSYLIKDQEQLPTGEQKAVDGTVFDLRTKTQLSKVLIENDHSFDHNFCFDDNKLLSQTAQLKLMAQLFSPISRVNLKIYSNQPGLQIYTPHELGEPTFTSENQRKAFPAICLEPQAWPDGPSFNNFPSILVSKGESYESKNCFSFNREQ